LRLRRLPHRSACSTAGSDVPHPIVPGHEIVGVVEVAGAGVAHARGARLACPGSWTCGRCAYCTSGRENLCDSRASLAISSTADTPSTCSRTRATASRCRRYDDAAAAPLLCAGSSAIARMAGDARRIGLYGFGAAAHIIAQVA
jgi:propanol-preferring alcohol dehydrogenase